VPLRIRTKRGHVAAALKFQWPVEQSSGTDARAETGKRLGALWEDGIGMHRCIIADRGTGSSCAEGVVGALAVALPKELLSWTDRSSHLMPMLDAPRR